ncbi:MAG: universal stress protein, partial [Anaerolineales bacterium]|nr:universal stress protein [Anaerolineales bacterium]
MLRYNPYEFQSAARDFERARNRAMMKEIIARFTGQSVELLSYDEVRKKLKAQGSADRGLQEIPLDAIVGSVGRYSDFTRDFLPRKDSIRERWTRVKVASTGLVGLPPIEVYKLGEVYFVKDGNHRVSVAKEVGATYIQAYVTEVHTRVPLTPEVKPDDLILKMEQVDFLENTRLDVLRPESDLSVSVPGQFEILQEHISVHRYFMGIERNRPISMEEAVVHWYDHVYMPVIAEIRARGILRGFPGRTEADMYLWIMEHRAALEKELGWQVRTDSAINDLVQRYGQNVRRFSRNLGEKLLQVLTQGKLLSGPPAGRWRQEARLDSLEERLFKDILVPVDGGEGGWFALEQALLIAQREGSILHGLHIVADESKIEGGLPIQAEFEKRCAEHGLPGQVSIVAGDIAPLICDRSRFVDLVVTNLAYPPGPQPFDRLESGFHDLIQRCPRPLLAT